MFQGRSGDRRGYAITLLGPSGTPQHARWPLRQHLPRSKTGAHRCFALNLRAKELPQGLVRREPTIQTLVEVEPLLCYATTSAAMQHPPIGFVCPRMTGR